MFLEVLPCAAVLPVVKNDGSAWGTARTRGREEKWGPLVRFLRRVDK